MPKFSAIVYAKESDKDCLARTLASLQVSSDILLINADTTPEIKDIGRKHKARVKNGIPGVTPGAYLMDTYYNWILVLRPGEVISDELSESLTAWRRQKNDQNQGFRFAMMEEHDGTWQKHPPELRLVNRKSINWTGELPPNMDAPSLRGPILRYQTEAAEQRLAS